MNTVFKLSALVLTAFLSISGIANAQTELPGSLTNDLDDAMLEGESARRNKVPKTDAQGIPQIDPKPKTEPKTEPKKEPKKEPKEKGGTTGGGTSAGGDKIHDGSSI